MTQRTSMPRWLWTLLFIGLVALAWVGRRPSAPEAMVAAGAPITCPPPPAFEDPTQPRQSPVGAALQPFRLGPARIAPLAGFSLQARVLGREDYRLGNESRYSPTDLALGWGPMAQPGMAEKLRITQGGRWYRYSWDHRGPPLPPEDVVRNSTNMHMVPADGSVARALAAVRPDDTVRVDGWLIRIEQDDGWRWQSSTSREDSGAGACELILVCSIRTM
jgi:hypothetical protein